MSKRFSDELRRAIEQSGLTQYAVGKETGIDHAQMSRFVNGKGGLSMEGIEAIYELLGLKLVVPEPKASKATKGKRAKK
jgi:transcriptional regulator with XRE-family HTH domain